MHVGQCSYHFLCGKVKHFLGLVHIDLIYIYKSTWLRISLGYITKNGMARSQSVRIISFNRKCQIFVKVKYLYALPPAICKKNQLPEFSFSNSVLGI